MAGTPKPIRKAKKVQKKAVEQLKTDRKSNVPFKERNDKMDKKMNSIKHIKHKNIKHTEVE